MMNEGADSGIPRGTSNPLQRLRLTSVTLTTTRLSNMAVCLMGKRRCIRLIFRFEKHCVEPTAMQASDWSISFDR